MSNLALELEMAKKVKFTPDIVIFTQISRVNLPRMMYPNGMSASQWKRHQKTRNKKGKK